MAQSVDILIMTADEFEAYALHPDNRDRRLELINGKVVEVVSSAKSSHITFEISGEIRSYLKRTGIGFGTSSQGGYKVGDERYIPDVGVVLFSGGGAIRDVAYNTGLSLAVEVLSPTDNPNDVANKLYTYIQHGITVWMVDPFQEIVTVYNPGQPAVTYRRGDVLVGEPVLPEFRLVLDDLFTLPSGLSPA